MFIRKDNSDPDAKPRPDEQPGLHPGKKRRRRRDNNSPSLQMHNSTVEHQTTSDRTRSPAQPSLLPTIPFPQSDDSSIVPSVQHTAAAASMTLESSPNVMLDPSSSWSSLGYQRQMMNHSSLGSTLISTPPLTSSLYPNLDSRIALTPTEMLRLDQRWLIRSHQIAEFNGINNTAVASFLGTEYPLALTTQSPTFVPIHRPFDSMLPQLGIHPSEQGSSLLAVATAQRSVHQLDSNNEPSIGPSSSCEQGLIVSGAVASQTHDSMLDRTPWRDTTFVTRPPTSLPDVTSPLIPKQRHKSNANVVVDDQPKPTGALTLFLDQDHKVLNKNQIYLRQQIEVFRATRNDLGSPSHGKVKPLTLQQVGVRCRHCRHLPLARRNKASTYFPKNLMGIYQAAQNISVEHLQSGLCPALPPHVRDRFSSFAPRKLLASGGGKKYWADAGKVLGLVDTDDGLRFAVDMNRQTANTASIQPERQTQPT